MDKNKLLSIGVVIALVVSLGSLALGHKEIVREVQTQAGGISSDLGTSWFSFGGVRQWAYHKEMNGDAASTTICAIQAPQVASSSLQYLGVRESTSSTTASSITFYKSKSQWVATTQIGADAFGANQNDVVIVATSTVLDTKTALFSKDDWIVVRQTGGTGTFSPVGSCGARWTQI